MTEWKLTKIESVVLSANTGLDAIKRAPIVEHDTGIKCLRIQDVSQSKKFDNWGFTEVEKRNFEKFQLKKNDIIIARTGATVGVNLLIKNDLNSVFNNGLIRIRANEKICNPLFLYYNFRTTNYFGFIESISGGTSTQPNMQINALLSYEILLPPLEIQNILANTLSSLDNKIELLNNQNTTLEKLADSIFKKWFVLPIKMAVEEGVLIEGFSKDKFAKWIDETIGGEWGKDNPEGDFIKPVKCIRGTDVADLNTGIPQKTPIRFVKETKFNSIEPQDGDLILEISGGTENQSTGRVCYINNDIKKLFNYPLVFSNFCRMLRVKSHEYSYFLYCYIQYLYNQDEFFNLENGSSGIKNLDYKALLYEIEYPMPYESLVIQFHNMVEPLFKKINQNKLQVITLWALRDLLLPKLMSSEATINLE